MIELAAAPVRRRSSPPTCGTTRRRRRPPGLALIDAAHWATEWPWLPVAAAALAKVVDVETAVSTHLHRSVDHRSKEPQHVKADPFVQLRLLDLQTLDSTADRLAHKRKTLPEIAEIDRLDGLLVRAAQRDRDG